MFTDKKWALKNIKWFNPPLQHYPKDQEDPTCAPSHVSVVNPCCMCWNDRRSTRGPSLCAHYGCVHPLHVFSLGQCRSSHTCPNFIIMGVSINPDPDAPRSASCSISSSSIGSSFTGVEGPGEVGVGVVALFSCLKSWRNSPGPTSSHIHSNNVQPSVTILCPAATLQTAENACIDSVDMNTIELITFCTNLCRQCRHTTKHI